MSELNERQQRLIDQLTPDLRIRRPWYEETMGTDAGQANSDLLGLVRMGVLVPESDRRGAYWSMSPDYGRTSR